MTAHTFRQTGLQTVATLLSPLDADLARIYLESHGIQAVVADATVGTVLPLDRIAMGATRLMVAAEDAPRARALLESMSIADRQTSTDELHAPDRDPGCGRRELQRLRRVAFAAVYAVLAGAALLAAREEGSTKLLAAVIALAPFAYALMHARRALARLLRRGG